MAGQDRNRGFSDLLSTASSLLNSSQSHSSSASYGAASTQGNPNLSSTSQYPKPSRSEIMASAQIVMNVAKSKLQKKPSSGSSSSPSEETDMGKLAGAASTLIGAVSSYGKLDDGNYGKYVHKAQDYLHSYEVKHGKPGTAPAPPPQASAYQPSQPQGNFQGSSAYSSAPGASYGQQSSTSYPPAGYPDARQSYGYGKQSQDMPSSSYSNVNSEPPLGYPPAGYPTSGGSYTYPSRR